MLKQRIITALILATAALWALFFWSDLWFAMFLLVATGSCAWEWSSLCNIQAVRDRTIYTSVLVVLASVCFWAGSAALLKPLVLAGVLVWIAIGFDLTLSLIHI